MDLKNLTKLNMNLSSYIMLHSQTSVAVQMGTLVGYHAVLATFLFFSGENGGECLVCGCIILNVVYFGDAIAEPLSPSDTSESLRLIGTADTNPLSTPVVTGAAKKLQVRH